MSILTGILEGKSESLRGHSGYRLHLSGTLYVYGNPIHVRLFGDYELPGGNPEGRFVVTTGKSERDREEGDSWFAADFMQNSSQRGSFTSYEQGGVFQGIGSGEFELEIESRKYGSMSDGWTINFG